MKAMAGTYCKSNGFADYKAARRRRRTAEQERRRKWKAQRKSRRANR